MELRAERPLSTQDIHTEPLPTPEIEGMAACLETIKEQIRTNPGRDFYQYYPPHGRITYLTFSNENRLWLTIFLTNQRRHGLRRGSYFDISLSATWVDDVRQEIGLIHAISNGGDLDPSSVVWSYANTLDRELWLYCGGIDEFAGAGMGCAATPYHLYQIQELATQGQVDGIGMSVVDAYLRKTRMPDPYY